MPDEKNPAKQERLQNIAERATKFKAFIDISNEESFLARAEKMNALFKKHGELQNNPEYKTLLAEKEILNLKLRDMAPTYVTQGYINRLK